MNEVLKEIEKQYGVKMGKFDSEKNRLFNMGIFILKSVEEYIKQIEAADLTNSQMFLDFCDDLNLLSVKY